MQGEFDLIATLAATLAKPGDPDEEWIGDDSAIVRPPQGWMLLAADTVVAGVHADLAYTSVDDLGWKAMAASVSDIAAMGGVPGHALVAVTAPPGSDVRLLYSGISAAAEEMSCPVVGGDLTNGPELTVTVAVTGSCPGRPVRRSGARPGDVIWVTGALGASAAGLRRLRSGEARYDAVREPASAVRAHARPTPRLLEGRAARLAGATAMIDVSDGLVADLGHIAESSGVGFRLEHVPVHPEATLEEAMSGGEDFALVFCAPPAADLDGEFAGIKPPIMIGECVPDPDHRSLDGEALAVSSGWQHSF
ncbi:MAG: thiamine-phosphate kinase [Acidimicrobiales bacterium]